MRDDQLPPADDGEEPEPGPGTLRPTQPGVLVGWALAGLVGGWALHPVSDRLGVVPPLVSWPQPLALWLAAAILGYTAWATYRQVQVRRERLPAHRAVNRLVLARACALVGALVAGGYAGYALSWLGSSAELADERILRSGIAAAACVTAVIAALLLERACRTRNDRHKN